MCFTTGGNYSMEVLGAAAALGLTSTIIFGVIAFYVLIIIGYWKVFAKAGKPAWHSIIPFLNTYDEYGISWDSKYGLFTIALTAIANVLPNGADGNEVSTVVQVISMIIAISLMVMNVLAAHKMAKAFGKGTGFAIGLFFLKPLFLMILGFGDAEYIGPQKD